MSVLRKLIIAASIGLLQACSLVGTQPETTLSPAQLEPLTNESLGLASLPAPKGVINVAVYGFKDQTGQYKQAPDSSFSTAVSQGGSAMLVKALRDSKWFQPVEREGLQDLLTERKILRAVDEKPAEKDKAASPPATLPVLTAAHLLMEGAIVGYDSNVTTGGLGVKFLGFSTSGQYRKDQVTVNLRAIDINNGSILHSVTTTKTVYSRQVQPGVYRYVTYKELLEVEAGYTYNEPAQMAVQEAIEAAVINLVVEGVYAHSWVLANADDINQPYLNRIHEAQTQRLAMAQMPAPLNVASREVSTRDVAPVDAQAKATDSEFGFVVRDIPLRDPPAVPADAPAEAYVVDRQRTEAGANVAGSSASPSPDEARAAAVQKQRALDGRPESPAPASGVSGSRSEQDQ